MRIFLYLVLSIIFHVFVLFLIRDSSNLNSGVNKKIKYETIKVKIVSKSSSKKAANHAEAKKQVSKLKAAKSIQHKKRKSNHFQSKRKNKKPNFTQGIKGFLLNEMMDPNQNDSSPFGAIESIKTQGESRYRLKRIGKEIEIKNKIQLALTEPEDFTDDLLISSAITLNYKRCGKGGWLLKKYSGEMVLAKFFSPQFLSGLGVEYLNRVIASKYNQIQVMIRVIRDNKIKEVKLNEFALLANNKFRITWDVPEYRKMPDLTRYREVDLMNAQAEFFNTKTLKTLVKKYTNRAPLSESYKYYIKKNLKLNSCSTI